MAISVLFNGVTYSIPQTGEQSWGENLTTYFVAIPQGALQKTGGAFTLSADANFGASFGLLSKYFSTRSSGPSTAGLLRLSVGDSIGWKNNAGDGNLLLSVDSSDRLVFNGTSIVSDAITALTGQVTALGPGSVVATISANVIVNSMINSSAAISYSKLALTGSIVNADISASAAIAFSKLAALTSAHILVGSAGNVATDVAVTGDISLTNAGVTAYSGTVPVNKGGINITSYSSGDTLYASGATTLSKLALGTQGKFLLAGASAPAWGFWNVASSQTNGFTASVSFDFYPCDGTSGAFTATLPAASGNSGKIFIFKKTDSSTNAITLDGNSSETIDGALTIKLNAQYEEAAIECDGSNWFIINRYVPLSANEIRLDGQTGFGSTNTNIFRFTTTTTNSGSPYLTLAQSSTNGDSITVNIPGNYSINFWGRSDANGDEFAATKNSTAAPSESSASNLAWTMISTNGRAASASWTGYLAAGDVIRMTTGSVASNWSLTQFRMAKLSAVN